MRWIFVLFLLIFVSPAFAQSDPVAMGDAYIREGNFPLAIESYSAALQSAPENAVLYSQRGWAYYKLADHDHALQDLSQAIQLDPSTANYTRRGIIYNSQENYPLAEADYTQALTLDPTYTTALFNRANNFFDARQYEAAIADYTRVLELKPQHSAAYAGRATTLAYQGDYRDAIPDYNRALEIDPTYAYAYQGRGVTYYQLRNYKHAIDDYSTAIQYGMNTPDIYYNRALASMQLKLYENAIADYTAALERGYEPRHHIYDERGDAHYFAGNIQDMEADYHRYRGQTGRMESYMEGRIKGEKIKQIAADPLFILGAALVVVPLFFVRKQILSL